jgi:plasmid stabilization system protein ParE
MVAYIAQDRPEAARSLVRRIRKVCGGLRKNPRIGPVVREFGIESIRERVVPPYRVVYQLSDREIRILAVVHGRAVLSPSVVPDED